MQRLIHSFSCSQLNTDSVDAHIIEIDINPLTVQSAHTLNMQHSNLAL